MAWPNNITLKASELSEVVDTSETPIELANISLENVDFTDTSEEGFSVMDKPYWGEDTMPEDISVCADGNAARSGVYLLENNNSLIGTFTTVGEEQLFAFVLNEKTKVSIRTTMDAAMDVDMLVFSLDSSSSQLVLIGASASSTIWESEYYSAVLEKGTYYVDIVGYSGTGDYKISYYQTNVDVNYEVNDSTGTATEVAFDKKVIGVIDCPYDVDIYKFTVTQYTWVRMKGNFPSGFELEVIGATAGSECEREGNTGNLYVFSPGTYWFKVSSKNGGYSSTVTYDFTFEKVSENTEKIYLKTGYTSKEGIEIKQSEDGRLVYVNGNMVDIRYTWSFEARCEEGSHAASIAIIPDSSTHVSSMSVVHYTSSSHPIDKYFGHGTAIMMTFRSDSELFYMIDWVGTGIFDSETRNCLSSVVTVLINPNTGKLLDIVSPNYYYTLNSHAGNGIKMLENWDVIVWN